LQPGVPATATAVIAVATANLATQADARVINATPALYATKLVAGISLGLEPSARRRMPPHPGDAGGSADAG
jgi:hypothetical protein